MNYLEWNNILSSYFFNPANAGKDIFLYLTKNDIIGIARTYFEGKDENFIWIDFIDSIKNGLPGSDGNILAKAIFAYSKKNCLRIDDVPILYPPYISYLVFFVLPLIENDDPSLNANNYYDRLRKFYNLENKDIGIPFNDNAHLNDLWKGLEEWANSSKNGELGLFKINIFSNSYKFVGKMFSQCILPPRTINRLSELFATLGLVPDTYYDDSFLKDEIEKKSPNIIPKNTLSFLKGDDELSKSIIQTIQRQYKKWTGETHEESDAELPLRKKKKSTIAPLFLQFKKTNYGNIEFSYRMYSSNDYPEDLRFGEHENLYQINGWSKTLPIEFKEELKLEDNFNKWIAKFPNRDVRLFTSAGNFQLSNDFWIETDILSKTERMYLFCKNEIQESIKQWGKTFGSRNFEQEYLNGLPENYSLFQIYHPQQSHSEFPILTLYSEKRIELMGGLKVNFRTFINDFPPKIGVAHSDGNEELYLQYKGENKKIRLLKDNAQNNCWLLPQEIRIDTDFYIEMEKEHLLGNELAYKLISSDNSAIKVHEDKLPKRDLFGKQITNNNSTPYLFGNNISVSNANSQILYIHLFRPLMEDLLTQIFTTTFNNHEGNKLCSFLSLTQELTTEDFFRAFEFYYSKSSSAQTNSNFNLTKIKKASLNFYNYIGILDYEYKTKTIVVAPPQFVFIPTAHGRKVLLIGARDAALVEEIIKQAPNYDLQVEITKQLILNEKLLLPDAITIKAFSTPNEKYGEKKLETFSKKLKIKFSSNYFPQVALQNFSANINCYENSLQLTDENDYDWARKVFNPETFSFEKDESYHLDKSFSLVEYKLNEYTYIYKLWKNNQCYEVDKNWGKFIALKHFNKNIILFDQETNKVAIPMETPLPMLLSKAIMLFSGLAPDFKEIEEKKYRVYENIPSIFIQNLFNFKLNQTPINKQL